MVRKCNRWSCWYALLFLTASGCGKALVFNDSVEGTVKLDGKPLGNVHVQFVPDEPGVKAPGSTGITDENGHYRLTRESGEPGALVGKHLVVFVRGREAIRGLGEQADAGESAKAKKDRRAIPSPYQMASKTPLSLEVKLDQHTYDLELSSSRR
jgi:hypothetical protein